MHRGFVGNLRTVTFEHEMLIGYCLQDKKAAKNEDSAASGAAGNSSGTGPKLSAAEQRMKELAAGGGVTPGSLLSKLVCQNHIRATCAR